MWAVQATPTPLAEFKLGVVAIAVGLRLIFVREDMLPFDPRNGLSAAMPHWVWTTVLLLWGAVTVYAVVWERPRLRCWTSFTGMLLWSVLVLVAWSFPTAPFVIVFFPLEAVICLWVWLRRTGTLTG